MKTKKYSNSLKAAFVAVVTLFMFVSANAQWELPDPSVPIPQAMEEVRTGSAIIYNVTADHTAGDSYRWAVVGGTITGSNNGAFVSTVGDSSIIEFSANTSEITVTWNKDLSLTPIGSFDGDVLVQKKTFAGGCPSQLQTMVARQWNDATAEIDAGEANYEMCSGDAVAGSILINVTGAPDDGAGNGFEVVYDVTANNLTDLLGNSLDATNVSLPGNGATMTISLPDGLISSNTTGDETFEIELISMHDDFSGAGVVQNKITYTITVHPTVETGPIVSDFSLTRNL